MARPAVNVDAAIGWAACVWIVEPVGCAPGAAGAAGAAAPGVPCSVGDWRGAFGAVVGAVPGVPTSVGVGRDGFCASSDAALIAPMTHVHARIATVFTGHPRPWLMKS